MDGNQAVIVAGIGCRRGCPADAIVALATGADVLAAPAWKRDEPGLVEAARLLGVPLRFVDDAALAAEQPRCPTRSDVVHRVTGFASVAEAAALAGGGVLVRARFGGGWATCALARHGAAGACPGGLDASEPSRYPARGSPHPGPLPQAGEGEERPSPACGRGLGEG